MNITPASLNAIFISFDTRFQKAFLQTPTFFDRYTMETPSNTRTNTYAWLGKIPRMREWIGERVVNNIAARAYSVTNKDYEDTIEVDRNDIMDDQIGVYTPAIDMLAEQAKLWPEFPLIELLKQGHLSSGAVTADGTPINTLTYDGQPFFNANHPQDVNNPASAVFQNYWANGMALNSANFNTVRSAMMAYLTEDGRPLGIMPDLLVVPPALEVTARQIIQQSLTAPAVAVGQNAANTVQGNALQGMADILDNPYLAGQDTTWYLLCTKRAVKPLLFQKRMAPQFAFLNKATDPQVFMRKKYMYGVDCRGAAGYGLWFLAAKAAA